MKKDIPATVTRSPGSVVSVGSASYLVGGGGYGATEAMDNSLQKAAQFIVDEFGCDAVIRMNSDRNSGGAFVKDTVSDGFGTSSAIGIDALLTWSDLAGLSTDEFLRRHGEHRKNNDPRDKLKFYAFIELRKLDRPNVMECPILCKEESPRFDTVEEACEWVKKMVAAHEPVREYLSRCRDMKNGLLKYAYGRLVLKKVASKVDARKRFAAGERVYMLPKWLDPNKEGANPWYCMMFMDPSLKESDETTEHLFNRLADHYKEIDRGRAPAFYTIGCTYGEMAPQAV